MSLTQIQANVSFFKKKIRCVLVHDHVLLLQGLRRLLEDEPDLEVVNEAGNAAEAARQVFEERPDVVIVDAVTFGLPAHEAEACLLRECPQTRVIFLSTHADKSAPQADAEHGAGNCNVRQASAEELAKMIRGACSNSEASAEPASPSNVKMFPQKRPLTAREREVLKLLAQGRTVRAAAGILGLSIKTVDAHKFNLMRKLGIHNKAELVMFAIQKRLVKIPANL